MTTRFYKEMGGYFGLEIKEKYDNINGLTALNCARNCLRYVIRAFKIKEIYLPVYTCPVVWQSVNKEKCKIHFYHIDKNFMPICDFDKDAYILYTNYFGICTKNAKKLAKKYKNLIVDNAQAFYMPPLGIASFNSIRKFFGVSDGALLYCNKKLKTKFEQDTSYQRFSHLLKRIDVSANFGYADFVKNDDSLIDEPIKTMSNLTKTIFNSIDIKHAKKIRLENFEYLSQKLNKTNDLDIYLDKNDVPMVYPYLFKDDNLHKKLIKNKIYVAQYWSPISKEYEEYNFQKYLIPLPIDQRYSKDDMQRIVEVINAKN